MQKKINDTIAKNKELYEINPPVSKLSLHCEYVSYCLAVSIFLGYLTLDIKDCLDMFSLLMLFPPFTSLLKCLLFREAHSDHPI